MRILRLAAMLTIALAACADRQEHPTAPAESPPGVALAVTAPPGASVSKQVVVPSGMNAAPFNVARYLTLPPNFSIAVYTRISNPRFLAVAPNGWLLASVPSAGKVVLIRPNGSGAPLVSDFATGLRKPHDIVFATIAGITYIYIAETHQINRYVYSATALTAQGRQIVITGLPDATTPGLGGAYGHELKNIAIDSNGKLYVSIASTCNACISDTQSNPVRGAIYVYNADGTAGRLYARGLRNAEGLAFPPGTNTLWVVVNNRDNIAYPFNDGTGNYGKVVPSYVDNHPPEEFTSVRDGGNYGWPFCNPNPDTPSGLDNMPFDLDYQYNASGQTNCAAMDRVLKGIQAHSAPLGLTFLGNTNIASAYRQGVVIGLHGSWNRTVKTGYKLVYFPWDPATQLPAVQQDFVTGWLSGSTNWGRPVDMVVDAQGNMFISDDQSGTIYKLTYSAPPPPPPSGATVTSLTLINADNDQPIAGYDPMPTGVTLNLRTLPTRNLNIRANTNPVRVGRVRFAYDGVANYRTEYQPPYAFAGDGNGVGYNPWTPTLGAHTVKAIAYDATTGAAGAPHVVNFTVIDQ